MVCLVNFIVFGFLSWIICTVSVFIILYYGFLSLLLWKRIPWWSEFIWGEHAHVLAAQRRADTQRSRRLLWAPSRSSLSRVYDPPIRDHEITFASSGTLYDSSMPSARFHGQPPPCSVVRSSLLLMHRELLVVALAPVQRLYHRSLFFLLQINILFIFTSGVLQLRYSFMCLLVSLIYAFLSYIRSYLCYM